MTYGIDKLCQLEVEGHSAYRRALKRLIIRKKEKPICVA